jgi:N-acetylneuraminic acid mutarotase
MSNYIRTKLSSIFKIVFSIGIIVLLQACQSALQNAPSWAWETIETKGQPTARHEASFLEHKGKLYLLGGRRINPVNVFDPSDNTWQEKSNTPLEIHHFQAVSLGDAIYIVGAMTGQYPNETPLANVIAYYPASDTFKTLHEIPLSRRRGGAGAVVHDGKIIIVGGIVNGHVDGYQPWLDEYNPSTGEWRVLPDATFARDHVQASVLNDKLYVFAGRTSRQRTNQVMELLVEYGEVFDLKQQEWQAVSQELALPTLRAGNMMLVWGDEIVVGGGESHTQESSHFEVDSFSVSKRTWSRWPNLREARHGSGFAILGEHVYVASGSANRGGGPELQSIERLKLPRVTKRQPVGDKTAGLQVVQNFHTLELDFIGPELSEAAVPNPFTDYRLDVEFKHASGKKMVRGFYAADGNSAQTGADSGRVWKVRFTPELEGAWTYSSELRTGKNIAIAGDLFDGERVLITNTSGSFFVTKSDKELPDFRAKGFLVTDGPYFRFRGTNHYWIKMGANSPENMLGFYQFDGNYRHGQNERDGEASAGADLHRFAEHAQDWRIGDPTWQEGKGKNIIGAYNYLASKGMNSNYFLTMNINGDGKDVWPFVSHTDFSRFDISKLDQWNIVFDHMQRKGILLHMVVQETENERLLDDGDTGPQRKLYFNELIARFSHHPGLVWNLGEENGPAEWSPVAQNDEQRKAMSSYFKKADPYQHAVLLHTHATPESKDELLKPQLGHMALDGLSFQVEKRETVNSEIIKWRKKSKAVGYEWLITMDEIGPWQDGAKPDSSDPNHDTLRRFALWGTLMAGGAGVEWYFGAKHPATDLSSEDWRLRDRLWTLSNHARVFFENHLPYSQMQAKNDLVNSDGAFVLAKENAVYAVYFPNQRDAKIDLRNASGDFSVRWFDPLKGGGLQHGSIGTVTGGRITHLGTPSQQAEQDWLVLIKKVGLN